MNRHLLFVSVLALCASGAAPGLAQVTAGNDTPLAVDQFVPDSFPITGQAIAQSDNGWWTTRISYQVQNNSGMNLFLGIELNQVTFGSCSQVQRLAGGLPNLPSPKAIAYSTSAGGGPPRGIYLPAGGRLSGAIELANCQAPNPGFPTAPLSLTLMIGKQADFNKMITYPINADLPIRQIQN